MREFECQRCGICCTDIGGRFSEEESRIIDKAFRELEKIGIYLAVSPNELSIPLFPNEAKTMIKLSKRLDIEFRPQPKLIILDGKKEEYIILEWDLGSRSCPFFDTERGCLIYDHRPLACRSFPIILKPEGYEILDLCPEAENYIGIDDRKIEIIFSNESRYAKIFNEEVKERKKRILDMIKLGIIVPSKIDKEKIQDIKRNITEHYLREPSEVVDILS